MFLVYVLGVNVSGFGRGVIGRVREISAWRAAMGFERGHSCSGRLEVAMGRPDDI